MLAERTARQGSPPDPRCADRLLGHQVANVELKQVDLNETMVPAIQAGRGRTPAPRQGDRCGGRVAGAREAATGQVLAKAPEAMQLRHLGTLLNIAGKRSSTINFVALVDLGQSLSTLTRRRRRTERSAS